jgi:ubiquitin C-terminal hydrolase
MSLDLTKYKDKGLTGLANLGNTCFMNACMQPLSHCYELNNVLDNINFNTISKTPESVLLNEWNNLRMLMWSQNCIVSPKRYVNTVHKISDIRNMELFSGFGQNDVSEFLRFIIDSFHDSLQRKVEMHITGTSYNETDDMAKQCYEMIKNVYSETYSEVLDIFYGTHVSLLRSVDNNTLLSSSPESFSILELPLLENTQRCSIYDCLDLYVYPEKLEGDDAWYNEKTMQKEVVTKSLNFWKLPNVLIVALKRFDKHNRKVNTHVTTPITNLDLSKYVIGYDKETFVYDLFGVCNHNGACEGGHYSSFVKNANNKWYDFNDTRVTEVTNETNIITPSGYCFFYRKISI